MIGGVGLAIDFDAADAAAKSSVVKMKSRQSGPFGPLRMIV